MKYKNVRVIRMPVIHDDNRHYFLNGDTGFRAVMAEDLPSPTLPINSIIDDIIEQQNCTIGVCPTCEDFVSDADNWIEDADNTYCSENCYNSRPQGENCFCCRKEILMSDDWLGIASKFFCSEKCADVQTEKLLKAQKNPNYDGCWCERCGEPQFACKSCKDCGYHHTGNCIPF